MGVAVGIGVGVLAGLVICIGVGVLAGLVICVGVGVLVGLVNWFGESVLVGTAVDIGVNKGIASIASGPGSEASAGSESLQAAIISANAAEMKIRMYEDLRIIMIVT